MDRQQWMLCDTAGVGGEGVLHLSTGSPFGHHPRLSMGCPRRGQWMSAREDIPLTSIRAYHIWSCGYSHSSHRLTPSPYIVYGLADTLLSYHLTPSPYIAYSLAGTLTHCIAYHSLRIPYMVLKTLSLIASPNSVSVYRIWSCGYSHPSPLSHLCARIHTEPPPEEAHHA